MAEYRGVEIRVVEGDVLRYSADLLVLKHAQALHGADRQVVRELGVPEELLPAEGGYYLASGRWRTAYHHVLFVGVEPLSHFSYQSIREFSRRALDWTMALRPPVRHMALTLHGVGFGLDETEAFESEIAGIVEAIDAGHYPASLTTISVVELRANRVQRLAANLARLLPDAAPGYREGEDEPRAPRLDTVGYDSAGKRRVIVAMPFSDSFEDVYLFGISQPVRAAGLICERMDRLQAPFTGDIVEEMKRRIDGADLMVADLSDANPNVYLEVGYAWGVGTPCVLICRSGTALPFDVQSHRCLHYPAINKLRETLATELPGLLDR